MKKYIYQLRKTLAFLCIYSFIFLCLLFYIKSHVYPESASCIPLKPDFLHIESAINSKVEDEFQSYLITYYDEKKIKDNTSWQLVSSDVYIYSSYLDKCPLYLQKKANICVKCIGFAKSNIEETVFRKCSLKINSHDTKSGIIFVEKIPESHNKTYTGVNLYCLMKYKMPNLPLPKYVMSITSSNKSVEVNVTNLFLNGSTKFNVNLCVRPLYGEVSIVSFAEFVSFYSIMGIDHFIFYYENVTSPFESFLMLLKKSNLSIDVLPWNIPLSDDLIHANGQMIFTQDCITRSKYKFVHTVIVDIDEFIVPKVHSSIKSLLNHLDELNPNAGSYIFQMSFFCDEYAFEKYPVIPLRILNHNKRQKSSWQHNFRSKYITKAARTLLSGIHFIWKHDGEWNSVLVPSSLALLHHYRSCCGVQQTWFFHLFKFNVLTDEVVFDYSLIEHKMDILNHSLVKFVLKPYYNFEI